jgi:hypothetical protein
MDLLMQNPMLTLVLAECVHCGSTAETVRRDVYSLATPAGVCCTPAGVETHCWYCGDAAEYPFWVLGRPFCSRACAADYGE